MENREIRVWDLRIHPYTATEFLELIHVAVDSEEKLLITGINAHAVNMIQDDSEFRALVNRSSLINIDGVSVLWALRFLGFKPPERVSCPDLFDKMAKFSNQNRLKVYLLGSTEGTVKKAAHSLRKKYPEMMITGARSGYFQEADIPGIIEEINRDNPQFLFLGMPSPKKESFAVHNLSGLNVNVILGVGGLFDILAGNIRRAPVWVQKIGMEWFFRMVQEPGKYWKRYLFGNVKFIFLVLRTRIIKQF
jgi:N-acetylglucosaminyldiphosphoundecaprenol N-acetyl-beta-D-mannosaminyltransferase